MTALCSRRIDPLPFPHIRDETVSSVWAYFMQSDLLLCVQRPTGYDAAGPAMAARGDAWSFLRCGSRALQRCDTASFSVTGDLSSARITGVKSGDRQAGERAVTVAEERCRPLSR